ncbi:hypothetical protein GCM10022267_73170 [Lentzea roselyniae]|uniref:Uncharacterized protein n=1 Tax=Lentzea roselyniae TaxID=531940 RepID=A0ABP7C3U4_9PSEU
MGGDMLDRCVVGQEGYADHGRRGDRGGGGGRDRGRGVAGQAQRGAGQGGRGAGGQMPQQAASAGQVGLH